jgi:hypothetical protein
MQVPTPFPQWLKHQLLAIPVGLRLMACALHLVSITALSLMPPWLFPAPIVQVPGADKWVHLAMYGLLGALLRWTVERQGGCPPVCQGLPLAAAVYGLIMEFLQLRFSGGARMFSWGDAAANLAGAVLFWYAAGRFLGNRPMREGSGETE